VRGVVLALCLGVLVPSALLPAPAWGAHTSEAWAAVSIRTVTSDGIFPGTPASFRPADPFTGSELHSLLVALGDPNAKVSTGPAEPVTIAGLDAALVAALGLRPVAEQFAAVARSAGIGPPARFGTEVVARLLGLRVDLPVADDSQEPQPQQPATRAEAAFSAARVLELGGVPAASETHLSAAAAGGGVQYVTGISSGFALPPLSPLQQQIVHTAVSLIGYPYVWGGTNEKLEPGFDCSGFVWRVFKLASYSGAPALSATLKGRTAAQMALEVPRGERIRLADLQPADIVFFKPDPHSKAREIDHTAIYLGNGWMIESSGQGVSLGRLDWYGKRFAWGRRPLAEIGLEAWPTPAT
jgi:cell wall-associated NlpC family hydrolase